MSAPLIIWLTPTVSHDPGHAILRLPPNWEGAQNPLYLTIQNTSTDEYLQTAQNTVNVWEATSCEWVLTEFQEINGQLELQIGPDLVDPLLKASAQSPNYAISLRDDAGHQQSGALMFKTDSNILPSDAKSNTGPRSATLAPHPAAQPPVIIEPVVEEKPEPEAIEQPIILEPEPVVAPAPPPPPPPPAPADKPTSNKKLLLLLLILFMLIGLIAAGAWWWMTTSNADQGKAQVAAPVTAVVLACDPSNMKGKTDVEFIKLCLEDKPDSQSLLTIIEQAKKSGHCSIAQRLYANRSQAGDVIIAAAYVKEYDPKFHKKSDCFPEANEATAKYWYETILANDPNNKEAKQRLEELN